MSAWVTVTLKVQPVGSAAEPSATQVASTLRGLIEGVDLGTDWTVTKDGPDETELIVTVVEVRRG